MGRNTSDDGLVMVYSNQFRNANKCCEYNFCKDKNTKFYTLYRVLVD